MCVDKTIDNTYLCTTIANNKVLVMSQLENGRTDFVLILYWKFLLVSLTICKSIREIKM
jgi:hypothetical protein